MTFDIGIRYYNSISNVWNSIMNAQNLGNIGIECGVNRRVAGYEKMLLRYLHSVSKLFSRGSTPSRRRGRTRCTGRSTGRSRQSALGLAEYVKLNLVPESPWASRRSARFPSRRIVNHNHGLNHGSCQSSHGCGVLVMPDTRNHQRNTGACDSILRENDGLAPCLE